MDEDSKAMLALYAGFAMHALISKNSHSNPDPTQKNWPRDPCILRRI